MLSVWFWQWFYQFYPFSDKNGDLLIRKKKNLRSFMTYFSGSILNIYALDLFNPIFLFRSMIIFIIVFFSSVFNSKAMDSLIVLCFW